MTISKRNFHIALDEYSEKAVERLKKIEKYDALIKEKCSKLLNVYDDFWYVSWSFWYGSKNDDSDTCRNADEIGIGYNRSDS